MKSPEDLADEDSLFIEVNDISIHYKTVGKDDPFLILLHGFGASLYSWQRIMQPLSHIGTVIAYDRPVFGLTMRPVEWDGENPYSLQAQRELLSRLMDKLGIQRAILVGNSAGGTVAMQFYLLYPDRVNELILADTAINTSGGLLDGTIWIFDTPQLKHLGSLIARQIQVRGSALLELVCYGPSKITDKVIDLYKKPLQAVNWDVAL